MKCKNCGKNVNENDKFCIHCGYKFKSPCSNCGKLIDSKDKFCIYCGASTSNKESIDYDKLFEDLEIDELSFLKIHKKINSYVELRKKYYKHDTLRSIYNDIKLQCEFENNYYGIASILQKMGRQLQLENRNINEVKKFLYAHIYALYKGKIRSKHDVGTVLSRDIEKLIGNNFNLTDMKDSILELIPKIYNESDCEEIFKIIKSQLKNK